MPSISFLGAIDTVTGSRYLVRGERGSVLVDCGLFQGPKQLRERNWKDLPFEPPALDAVILSHAHLDHSGYLPRLVAAGFTGPVYCTFGTRDLLQLLLPDSGHLLEEEAEHANKGGYARHAPALPLYTRADAERCLSQVRPIEFHTAFAPAPGFVASFTRAGHIVGSACIGLEEDGVKLAFTGDVGRPRDPIMRPPEALPNADYLVVESTYGDREHPREDIEAEIAKLVIDTVEKGGVLVVPSFAVGRAQHLLHLLAKLRVAKRIPACPVYLDSPMAIDATGLFYRHANDHTLTAADCAAMSSFPHYARSVDDSKAIANAAPPMIVISASGMCTGGRVLHHLARVLPDERSTILFVGYQAAGTRGRTLVDGATELKIHGRYVPVRARIARLEGLSAHADHRELVAWLRASAIAPRDVFVTHGEPSAADGFRRRLVEELGWKARVPEAGETVYLASNEASGAADDSIPNAASRFA